MNQFTHQPNILELQNLTKRYGKFRGVEDLSLEVKQGTIFGFLGPNGAGKSTTINMLVNLTRPTSGKIILFNKDNQHHGLEARHQIGYVAGDMALEGSLTGRQMLEYFSNLRQLNTTSYRDELAERLQCDLSRKIKTLSRGNRQKIALIAALMHKPQLLILDEPTSGLDPLMQTEFNKLLAEHKQAGGTTFISSHVLSEVQELCDRVAFIREGKIIVNKPLSEIVRGAPKNIRCVTKHPGVEKQLGELKGIAQLRKRGHTIKATYQGEPTALLRRLANLDLEDVSIEDVELDSIFSKYYEGDHA